jgi:hypothetical protein
VTVLARSRSNCRVNYRPVLSSEGEYTITKPQMSEGNLKEEENFVVGLGGAPSTRMDRPTDCRT